MAQGVGNRRVSSRARIDARSPGRLGVDPANADGVAHPRATERTDPSLVEPLCHADPRLPRENIVAQFVADAAQGNRLSGAPSTSATSAVRHDMSGSRGSRNKNPGSSLGSMVLGEPPSAARHCDVHRSCLPFRRGAAARCYHASRPAAPLALVTILALADARPGRHRSGPSGAAERRLSLRQRDLLL